MICGCRERRYTGNGVMCKHDANLPTRKAMARLRSDRPCVLTHLSKQNRDYIVSIILRKVSWR